MKKLVLVTVLLVFGLKNYAQTSNDYLEITRDILKVEKKAAIADIMTLTEDESVAFWELYNEYQSENYVIQNKRIAIIKDFAANYENLTDEKADELLLKSFAFKAEILKLKKTYYKRFKKIIPIGQAARFFQAESKIDNIIDAELAIEIPLLKTK